MHPDFEFKKVPTCVLENKELSEVTKNVLINVGLPGFVSPHMYFGGFEKQQILPSLSTWSWASEWEGNIQKAIEYYKDFYVVGCGQNSEPIVLKPSEDPIYQVQSNGEDLIFVNSDINKLYASLDIFLNMIDEAVLNDANVLLEQRLSEAHLSKFEKQLVQIDLPATDANALWTTLIKACGQFYRDV